MKVSQSLQSISLYPITSATVNTIAVECGLNPDATFTAGIAKERSYLYAKARIYAYLAEAPTVSEAGATYSFTDEERKRFRMNAMKLMEEAGETDSEGVECGYFGEDF